MDSREDDRARVGALQGYGVLDSPNEAAFDAIVRDAASTLDAPIALISLIDENRQWFKAKIGIEPTETPRSISFCTHAIRGPEVLVVSDATRDERFCRNPLVTGDPNIRFYAGAPLKTPSGIRIGTICVIDTTPRGPLTKAQVEAMQSFAARTIVALEARKTKASASKY